MIKHEFHTLRKVTHGSYKKWVCRELGCKFSAKRPIDILGETFSCPKCASIFVFANEDIKQQGNVDCPVCSGSKSDVRIVETEILNDQYKNRAIEVILDESVRPTPKVGRPPNKTPDITKAAMTEEAQALTEAMIMAGIAGIKLKKLDEETSTDPNTINTTTTTTEEN